MTELAQPLDARIEKVIAAHSPYINGSKEEIDQVLSDPTSFDLADDARQRGAMSLLRIASFGLSDKDVSPAEAANMLTSAAESFALNLPGVFKESGRDGAEMLFRDMTTMALWSSEKLADMEADAPLRQAVKAMARMSNSFRQVVLEN